jgi:hypothetical protein
MSRPRRIPSRKGVAASAFSRDDAFDFLPVFAGDEAIGAMLLGFGREKEWRQIVTLLEIPKGRPYDGWAVCSGCDRFLR